MEGTKPITQVDSHDKDHFLILIVDDDELIISFMNRVITKTEFQCVSASDGNAALSLVDKEPIDLIIADINMPGMSGLDLALEIGKLNSLTQIALMTGFKNYESVAQAINLSPMSYLQKPFSPENLLEVVSKAYKRKQNESHRKKYTQSLERTIEQKTRELDFKTKRLAAEKDIMHGIIANANFGLIAVDSSGTIHLINRLVAELFGIDSQKAASSFGQSINELIPQEIAPSVEELFKSVLEGAALQEVTSIASANDKRLNIIAYPICSEEVIITVVFVIHDITEKETLQSHLLQSSKLASIGELAAGVAHEINNPLGFITSNCITLAGYLKTLKEYITVLEEPNGNALETGNTQTVPSINGLKESLDIDYVLEDIDSLLAETLDGLARMSKIVLDLKTFARADSDSPQSSQINSLVDDALNLVKNETKYKLKIKKSLADIPEILCFPNQLVQVFTNLFINAAHAVREEGVLSITTSCQDDHICIAIRDNGSGIPEKVLSKIFDPFFTTKEPGNGTGMGLSISHGIIEKHNGKISATSTEGEGTEFLIILPRNVPGDSEEPDELNYLDPEKERE